MANEYVLASDVVSVLKTMHEEGYCIGNNDAMLRIFEKLANLKMVEAEPVVHAHWGFYMDETGDWWDKCSACGGKLPNEGGYCCGLPRCPHCGAHMDEEVADA